jgi:ferritin-like protein
MGKNIGKSLLGIFVQMEEEEKKETPTTAPAASVTSSPASRAPSTSTSPASTPGAQDDTVIKLLSDALDKANLEGFDYYEFAQMLQALKPSLPSEQALFQTAFTSSKVMGATKENLIQTAGVYLDLLNKKAQEFETACQAAVKELVTGREDELKAMDVAIQEKAAAIQKLTEEINNMTAQKTQVTNDIGENRLRIDTRRNNFTATLQVFTSRIQGDIEKVNKYIQ